jgi:tetratricopeptide (TPR) repeat protein
MKARVALLLVCNALFFTSCSSLWKHRGATIDSSKSQNATVPKEQYDELARKYQELLNLSKNQPSQNVTSSLGVALPRNVDGQKKPEVGATTAIDPSELVNRIDTAIPDVAKIDSVDALNPEIKAEIGPPMPTSMGVAQVNNTDEIDDQILRLREVQEKVSANKFENALMILKELENSKEKQIVVRAKMMLGDLLFNQGEYDLASQVYDEIVKKYAFSGFVLKALGKLVTCSEKLKQPEKQAKYYSLLHDFFEAS